MFTEGMAQTDFEKDKRTQQAVVMSLIVLGEAATKVTNQHPAFAQQHKQIPWRSMRGMRNRIACSEKSVERFVTDVTEPTTWHKLEKLSQVV